MGNKIFGIGLSRTGTMSLSEALKQLGYRTAHFAELRDIVRAKDPWFTGDFATDCLADYDAALDLPIPVFYPQLDERYPGSKYILTIRTLEPWLASVRHLWEGYPMSDDFKVRYRRQVRLAMYGIQGFSATRLRFVHETHVRNVHWFFRDRPKDLLVMDICGGAGWNELCPFLEKDVPAMPFPWVNKGK